MPNNAEIIERLVKEATIRKIIMAIDEAEVKSLDEINKYLRALIAELNLNK